jgi:hypothetical protein
MTVYQVAAEAGFQGLNTAAQRRLAEVYGGRRTGKVAVFGEGNKVTELA